MAAPVDAQQPEALRTRDGVVAIDEWRRARVVRSFLETMYGASPLFHSVHLVATKDGPGIEAHVWVLRDGPDVRRGLPAAVDDVKIVLRVVDEPAGTRRNPA